MEAGPRETGENCQRSPIPVTAGEVRVPVGFR